jgi:hypothetical protein
MGVYFVSLSILEIKDEMNYMLGSSSFLHFSTEQERTALPVGLADELWVVVEHD